MVQLYQKWFLIFFVIGILLVVSCNNNSNNICEAEVLFSPLEIDKKQSDIFCIDTIIPLETNDSSLIGMVSDIIVRSSGFYLVDKEMSGQVVKFDGNGNYLYSINQRGRGPGEFLSLTSFCVDFNDKLVYLYDSKQKKIICYNSESGQYIREFFVDFFAASFSILPNNKDFLFYFNFTPNKNLEIRNSYPQFVIVNAKGEILNKLTLFDKRVCIPNIPYWDNIFTSIDSTLYCFSTFSDIIYAVNGNNDFEYKYSLNYMNDNTRRIQKLFNKIKKYEGVDFERNQKDRLDAKINRLFKVNFTDKYFYFAGDYAGNSFFYIYNPTTFVTFNLTDLTPDVIGDNLYFNASDKENYYIVLPVLALKRELSHNENKFDGRIAEVLDKQNENDNPVIIKIKML